MFHSFKLGAGRRARPLLPYEPRILDARNARRLTDQYLFPALAALEVFFLEVRTQVDIVLSAAKHLRAGKPYPLGQCLEISLAVAKHLTQIDPSSLSETAQRGRDAFSDFQKAGGTIRLIWGELRGKYFQNAFLIGSLYVDVSNDTVIASKPKVEILPFDLSGLKPITDYIHFSIIAQQYWKARLYPNHILPDLAPNFPTVMAFSDGRLKLGDTGGYMVALNWAEGFRPAEAFLSGEPLPQEVFTKFTAALKDTKLRLPASSEEGKFLALQNVRRYRKKRWHQNPLMQDRAIAHGLAANHSLSKASMHSTTIQTHSGKRASSMNILFIHQNFPGQFKHLAPALVQQGHSVAAMTMQKTEANEWQGVRLVPYMASRGTTPNVHPWVSDFETKIIRGEACFRSALKMKEAGYRPDVIIAHHGWGESLFLKDVWPQAKLSIYCEFYYHSQGADVGFDPEFPAKDPGDVCRLRLKNLNNLHHFEVADAGISPTHWQASTFPEPFRSKLTVVHDGIDTQALSPNPNVSLTLNGSLTLTKQDEVITFVNRNLEPYRGYHIFMRALPEILRRRPQARVLIVGGDDVSYGARPDNGNKWKDIFAAEVRPQISDADWLRVHFLGNIPYQHFIPLLQLSTVHVYLTYPFVLSWSLLEAMSVGCAIVASDTQPLHEAIKHDETGRLVDFFDFAGLSEEVCNLLADSDMRKRLGQNARAFAQARYDLKTVCLPRQIAWVQELISS